MKKIACILLTVLILVTMIPFSAITAFAATADNVQFYRWNEATGNLEPDTHNGCVVADDTLSDIGVGYADWVIVKDKVQTGELNVHGEANIILAEGGELTAKCINRKYNPSILHIYGTSADGKGGTLRIAGGDGIAISSVDIDLCGGSVIVDEGYHIGFGGKELAVHGGSVSIRAEMAGVKGCLFITGGSADIAAISISDFGNDVIGIIGSLLMEGGDLKITATFGGIKGNATVSGGKLDILASTKGIYNGVLTLYESIERIHIAVNTLKMPSAISGNYGVDCSSACEKIAGNYDNVLFFNGQGTQWTNPEQLCHLGINSFENYAEILFLPPGSEAPDFPPYYATGSTLSSGNVTIVCTVAVLAVGAFAAAYFVAKRKKKAAPAAVSDED